jgi:hypothetical protein
MHDFLSCLGAAPCAQWHSHRIRLCEASLCPQVPSLDWSLLNKVQCQLCIAMTALESFLNLFQAFFVASFDTCLIEGEMTHDTRVLCQKPPGTKYCFTLCPFQSMQYRWGGYVCYIGDRGNDRPSQLVPAEWRVFVCLCKSLDV